MRFGTDHKQGRTKKNTYQFNVDRDRKIQISSNFDGGNISLIKQVTQLQYKLQCVPDVSNSNNKKCWFYFSVSAPKNFKIRLYIQGISIYQSMYQNQNWGKPVFRIGQQNKWQTLKDSYLIYRDQVNLMIDFNFQANQTVYFAMSIPFTYWEMENYINDLKYLVPDSISLNDEIIKETKTGKNLHMLTIQDKCLKQYKQKSNSGRCIVFVTSRVHPGEVTGTYCLMGMLDFILRPFSLQSQILRKMFTFVIIPMVNPEGVYQGNYRMDLQGQNLNRVYLDPHPTKNQTVYAIKEKIVQFLKRGDRIMFHFDLHSHSTLRRSFIYGNAFDDIILQTETEMYCRFLDKNCKYFQQSLSQFGQKHMKFKDKGESMSKEGCARVVMSKMASITYSYTVQSSIFPIQSKSYFEKYEKYEPTNLDFKIDNENMNKYGLSYDDFQDKQRKYSEQPNVVDQNKNLGIKIMISILDLVLKNPYSGLNQKDLDETRKQIVCRILQNEERFKMLDTKAYHKSKFISQFAKSQFQNKFKDEWNWLQIDKVFQKVLWPQNFNWFKFQVSNLNKTKKVNKLKTQSQQRKICTRSQNDVTNFKIFPESISNRIKLHTQIQELKQQSQRLPLIRKSLETKRFKTEQKEDSANKILEKTQLFKYARNILITNRSNILLTFLDDAEQKIEQKKISKKRITSLKMTSLNRNSAQKASNSQKACDNDVQPIESDFSRLKPSHSQGQLPTGKLLSKQRNDQEGLQFEDKLILKNLQTKNSRKQLMNRKMLMLKKINESKKQSNKNSYMKFPQIGKAFLITNAKRKFQKIKTTVEQNLNQQHSTIQSNQLIQKIDENQQNQQSSKARVQSQAF